MLAIHLIRTDQFQEPWLDSNVVVTGKSYASLQGLVNWIDGYECAKKKKSIPGSFELIMFCRGITTNKKVSVPQTQLDAIFGLLHWLDGFTKRGGGLIPGHNTLYEIYIALREDCFESEKPNKILKNIS